MTEETKQKKQNLGIFYTPPEVVNFIFDILKIWKEKEEKESGRWESRKHFPSVVDPAAGEGVFLKKAIESQFTIPKYIWGVDIDDEVKKRWEEINLLKSFGSRANLDFHFYHQNGLLPLPERKMLHKKGGLKEFDAVVGNPPYGGIGLGETKLSNDLIFNLSKYEVLPEKIRNQFIGVSGQRSFLPSVEKANKVSFEAKTRIKSFPIEILFIDRFIQLAKPGGWIAIIIPDGILTNSNSHYVREFVSKKARVEAIVSLPRDVFKNVGTSAKTSILFLQKYKDQDLPAVVGAKVGKKRENYPVFLASVDSLDEKNFNLVKDNYKNYYNKTMSKKNLVQITTDEKGREIVMVRADKTLKEMMEEKPGSRWNPEYWHIKFTNLNDDVLPKLKWKIECIGNYEDFITYGPIVTGKKFKNEKDGVIIINQEEILFTGLDLSNPNKAKENSPWVIKRAMPKENDLLLARSGVGGVGKNKITIFDKKVTACVGCFVDILRLKGISPFYTLVFWKGYFGWNQIDRIINGVGTVNISFDEIRSVKIPLIPEAVQKHIESAYRKMSKYHDKAMEAKKNNDEAEYKKNIEIAEIMLKDLIAKTEAVVRGERKDVI